MKDSKKALLIISFGSSYADARKSIENIELYISNRYQKYDCFRAFTSRRIIKKLKQRDGIMIDTPVQALEKIHSMGYTDVVCQSLHVIPGIEYEMTCDEVKQFGDMFRCISLGKPLLYHLDDYKHIAQMVKPIAAKREAVLLMGHGTEHHSNAAYCMLEDYLRYYGINNVYMATVEGFPPLEHAINKMQRDGAKTVTLMPFMIVAGDHAKNDMAGEDDDSWKNVLEEFGFQTEIDLTGLGDYVAVAELFYRHAKEAKKIKKD